MPIAQASLCRAPGDVFTSARAYCGAAHGRTWPLDPALTTPDDVVLRYGGSDFPYRLVHDLRLGLPARDGEGRLLYLPSYQDVLAISALAGATVAVTEPRRGTRVCAAMDVVQRDPIEGLTIPDPEP